MNSRFDPGELTVLASSLHLVTETEETANFLWTHALRFQHEWQSHGRVTASNIPIPLPRKKGLFPVGCELDAAFLSFRFRPGDEEHLPSQADYQVLVKGLLITSDASYELEDHWRLDTHLEDATNMGNGNLSHELHPIFHFQRGGNAQDNFANDSKFVPSTDAAINGEWRSLFQCPGPRMPALPMDPLLGIDFYIGQANGAVWNKLRNIPEYFTLIERAQNRLWRPFFKKLKDPAFQRLWLGTLAI